MQCNTFDLSPIESIANKTIKKFQPCCWVNRVDQTRRNPVSTRNRVSKSHHLADVSSRVFRVYSNQSKVASLRIMSLSKQ